MITRKSRVFELDEHEILKAISKYLMENSASCDKTYREFFLAEGQDKSVKVIAYGAEMSEDIL